MLKEVIINKISELQAKAAALQPILEEKNKSLVEIESTYNLALSERNKVLGEITELTKEVAYWQEVSEKVDTLEGE